MDGRIVTYKVIRLARNTFYYLFFIVVFCYNNIDKELSHPTALHTVQITRGLSTNISRYLYSTAKS